MENLTSELQSMPRSGESKREEEREPAKSVAQKNTAADENQQR